MVSQRELSSERKCKVKCGDSNVREIRREDKRAKNRMKVENYKFQDVKVAMFDENGMDWSEI